MSVKILINNNDDPKADYITWCPTPCKITSDEPNAVEVVLNNKNPNQGGQVVFFQNQMTQPAGSLQFIVPPNGSVDFHIAGKVDDQTGVGFPSVEDKDTIIGITEAGTGNLLGEKALMVRVRKNANTLTIGERDRFLDAIVDLNQAGAYVELQNMHLSSNSREIHGRSCFLPWHRAFLLDLERKLQEIEPSVTLPYWKFDEPAPNVFRRDFMGVPGDAAGTVDFSGANPMVNWRVEILGVGSNRRIMRSYSGGINPALSRAAYVQNDEGQTLNLGDIFSVFSRRATFLDPGGIEGDPHGSAHVSFGGEISSIGTAPADPLFFMLHCNVDRLWAKWQWVNELFEPINPDAYPNQGAGDPTNNSEIGIGNFTGDTMWPWNGVSGNPRPNHAPGGGLPTSPLTNVPGPQPKVEHMIDYQGQHSRDNNLHFSYEDVPYTFDNTIV